MKFLIYKDKGVSPFSMKQAFRSMKDLYPDANHAFVNAENIKEGALAGADIFIMPGGRDVPYHEKLSGIGNSYIREFVGKGGVYLGICAGAYYGCSEIVFAEGEGLEVKGSRELGFFPGKASGPLYDINAFSYTSESGAKASLLETGDDFLHVYYNGGCFFSECEASHIHARYGDLESSLKSPAIIQRKVGNGEALLMGVHLEYRFSDLCSRQLPTETLLTLEASEGKRKNLLKTVLKAVI